MNNPKNLKNILERLSDLLFDAWSAFLVAKNLDSIIDSNDFIQEHYFLVTAYVSCTKSVHIEFSKLLSNDGKETSVGYLLNECKKELSAFTDMNQDYVLSAIQKHRKQLATLNKLAEQVRLWRNKAIAHLDREYVNGTLDTAKMQPVEMEQVGKGLILLQEIINVYREWLGMGLLQLEVYETNMNVEWEYFVGLIQRNNEFPAPKSKNASSRGVLNETMLENTDCV